MDRAKRVNAAAEDLKRAGVKDAPVEIVPYDPSWRDAFEDERARLEPLLGGTELHHIGSTAVEGLAAKPVVDMMALVGDLDAPIKALVLTGRYDYPRAFNATLENRRFLCYPTAAKRTHHLHLVVEPSELQRHLRFVEMLKNDPLLAGEYVKLKEALAERHRTDREAYTEGKAKFINDALLGGRR